ncbi:MAG: hypothetical protein JXB49_07255 [Bacteroidales bacterium]|nr:hypothetical protein [Bacteroidales bacterium]
MKKLSYNLVFALVCAGLVLFNSCEKDSGFETSTVVSTKAFKFSKAITVADASGLNSIDIIISTNDELVMNSYMAEDLELHVFRSSDEMQEARSNLFVKHADHSNTELNGDVGNVGEVAEVIADFTYCNSIFQDGMQAFYVSRSKNWNENVNEDKDLRYRKYRIYTFTSDLDNVRVERNCGWPFHNVFARYNYVMTEADYLNDNWSVGTNDYEEIDNGDYQTYSKQNSYKMRVFIKSQYADCFDDAPFWY